jgi:hypothetical protein
MIFAMEDAAAPTEEGSSTVLFFDEVVGVAGGAFLGVSLLGFICYATVVGVKQNVWGTLQEQLVECRSSSRSIVSDATRVSPKYLCVGLKIKSRAKGKVGFI